MGDDRRRVVRLPSAMPRGRCGGVRGCDGAPTWAWREDRVWHLICERCMILLVQVADRAAEAREAAASAGALRGTE